MQAAFRLPRTWSRAYPINSKTLQLLVGTRLSLRAPSGPQYPLVVSTWHSGATGAMATSRRDEQLLDLEGDEEPNPFLSPPPPDLTPAVPAPAVPPRSNNSNASSTGVAEGAGPPSHSSSTRGAAGSSGGSRPNNGNPFARELEEERVRLNVSCCKLCCCHPVSQVLYSASHSC